MKTLLWVAGGAAAVVFAVSVGGARVDVMGAVRDLARGELSPAASLFLYLRLPRVVLAAVVGALLAGAGALLQGVLRNPLADPYLLGVSGGAALGAVAGVALGVAFPAPLAVLGAIAALAVVLGLSKKGPVVDTTRLVLAGAAFHSVASSLMTLILFRMSGRPEASGLYFWLLGGLTALPWGALAWLALLAAMVTAAAVFLAPAVNVLGLGRDGARALGLDADRALWLLLLLAAAATGLAVTFNGMIPFIGLLTPHAARALAGGDQRRAIPTAALLGALLTLIADALGRWVAAPREVPTGVIASLAGAPFFILLLRRGEKS